ncbi:MAG: DUF4268 domain-containing protein, partial [Acidobacteriota bacterium]
EYKPELLQTLAERSHQQNLLIEKLSLLLEPSPDFIRLAIKDIETRNLTEKIVENWKPVLEAAIKEWVKQQRLMSVLRDDIVATASPIEVTECELVDRHGLRPKFWATLLERAKVQTDLHGGLSSQDSGWIATTAGKRGLTYVYKVNKHDSNIELYIDQGKDSEKENLAIFDTLAQHKQAIEKVFGEPLSWERLEGKRACRIAKYFELGGYRDEAKWPEVQDAMIKAMVQLDNCFAPFIAEGPHRAPAVWGTRD